MLAIALSAASIGHAQVTTLGNNSSFSDYVGCDGTSAFPLRIMHNDNQPIQWWTDSIQRMQLYRSQSSTINTSFNVRQNGYLGLSNQPLFFSSTVGPFSRLHLADSCDNNPIHYAQVYGFRPWMKNGITFTGNQDQGYIGQKFSGTSAANDSSDMVIQWSDNDDESPWPTDRLRFLFTDDYNDANPPAYGARGLEGLESFRIFVPNDTVANVGIGDFHKATVLNSGTMVDPTERLDVLTGRLRIRELPNAANQATANYEVMVVDNSASPSGERGVVKWVDPSVFTSTGSGDCDWIMAPASNSMYTAATPVGTNGSCPETDWAVGIGTGQPDFKLDVQHSEDDADMVGGIRSIYQVAEPQQATSIFAEVIPVNGADMAAAVGVDARVTDAGDSGIGVAGRVTTRTIGGSATKMEGLVGSVIGPSDAGGYLITATGADAAVLGGSSDSQIRFATAVNATVDVSSQMDYCTGVASYLSGEKPSEWRIGFDAYVLGEEATSRCFGARLYAADATGTDFGVYAEATGSGDFAGYFIGDVHVTGDLTVDGTYPSSDAMLKTDVEPIASPLELLGQLQPRQYSFVSSQFTQLDLPEGTHMGFIAQEVQDVLPNIVKQFQQPSMENHEGEQVAEAFNYLGVNYTEVIPLLVAGMQAQQAQISAQSATIAQMQEQLAACCASPNDDGTRSTTSGAADEGAITPSQERFLRIAPNPFTDRTTLYYTVERAGRAQLLVNSSDGRELIVLSEAQREAGEYQQVWSTEHLAPGVYHITLLLDGELLVKRAVKVGR